MVGERFKGVVQVGGEVVLAELHDIDREARVCVDVGPEVLDKVWVTDTAQVVDFVQECRDETLLNLPLSPTTCAAPARFSLHLKQLWCHVFPGTQEVVAVSSVRVAIVA